MSVFSFKKKSFETSFRSREEAFSAMLAYLVEEEKLQPMEAAKQANEFAEIFAKNMGLPTKVEPEKQGYDRIMYYMKETSTFIKENPQVVEYLLPTVTFLAGLFTGSRNDNNNHYQQQPQQPSQQQADNSNKEPIDFDKVP